MYRYPTFLSFFACLLIWIAGGGFVRAATVSTAGTTVLITLGNGENISDLNTSTATAVITVNTVGSANNTLVGTPTGVTVTNNTVVIDTVAFSSFTGFSVLGGTTTNVVTVGVTGLDLTSGATANTNQTLSIDLSANGGTGTLNINGPILPKNAGTVVINATTVTIAAAGDITATTGSVTITGTTITSAGDLSSSGGGNITVNATGSAGSAAVLNGPITTTGASAGSINVGAERGTITLNGAITAGTGGTVFLPIAQSTGIIFIKAPIRAGTDIRAASSGGLISAGQIDLAANLRTTLGEINLAPVGGIVLSGAVSLNAGGSTVGKIILGGSIDGAHNLTLEAVGVINVDNVGQTTALGTITTTNSGGTNFNSNFTAARVVVTDTTGSITFNGTNTNITERLTTAAKGYSLAFGNAASDNNVIAGAPVFLNTGDVGFEGTTVLSSGATITSGFSTTVNLSGTITSGGAFNIGERPTGINISDNTQLILNSASLGSTFAGTLVVLGSGTFKLLGVGTLTLSADSSLGVTTGDTINVINGTLDVTGKLGASSTTTLTNGTLTGPGGTVGILTLGSGTVIPRGTLNTAAVSFSAATDYSVGVLTTTTASNLKTASAINLGGATLSLHQVATGLAVNNTFTIIDNTHASNSVTGIFAGLPQGTTIATTDTAGSAVNVQISYVGGTNSNDVTLKVVGLAPNAPNSVSALSGNGQAVVSFGVPVGNGGTAVTSYTVTATPVGGGTAVTGSGTFSPITVSGLSNGTPYTFTVKATNSVGTGSASSASTAVTPATTPGVPTSVSAISSNAQAVVSFTVPASNGGATISSYTVTATPVGGGTAVTGSGSSSPITVSGLSNGTAYTFTVKATNSVGTGSASSPSAAITVEKLAQTITWAAPIDRLSTSGNFTLNATASSSLPVEFVIVSGPAILSGTAISLTGASGTVVIRASQSGNAIYQAASDVTASFYVSTAALNIYFGSVTSADGIAKFGDVAGALAPGATRGSLLFSIPGSGVNTFFDFTLNADGAFSQSIITAAPLALTIRGTLVNGRLQGTIEPLSLVFTANVSPVAGATGNIAGFYTANALGAILGTQAFIIGTNSQVLVVVTTTEVSTSALTTLGSDNAFSAQATASGANLTLRGSIDPSTTATRGSLSQAGKADVIFLGLASTTVRTDRLISLSSRGRVGPSPRTLITGFVIGGSASKRVLLRATGPALASFGVTGTLPNPRLQLYDGNGKLILENDDWSGAETLDTSAHVGAFALVAGSKDAALVTTLAPGAYTMHVVDNTGAGVGLAEIYDAGVNPNGEYQRLINIAARGEVGIGEDVLIGGFVVTGNAPKRVLIRGIGPALAAFGVSGVLADPRLRVYKDNQLVGDNDNWSTVAKEAAALAAAARDTGAFTLANASKDAALILTLAPGAYTAQVSASDGVILGAALVEIYELPW